VSDWPPSPYTPLFRGLFGSERQRELNEVQALYNQVQAAVARHPDPLDAIGERVWEHIRYLPDVVRFALVECLSGLIDGERRLFAIAPPTFEGMSVKEFVLYRNMLLQKQYFFANIERHLELLERTLMRLILGFAQQLPEFEDPSPFTIPLAYALPDLKDFIERVYGTLLEEQFEQGGLFAQLTERIARNLHVVAGVPWGEENRRGWKTPGDVTGPLEQIVRQFLGGTPLEKLLLTPVPLRLSREERFNHTHIVGGTGAGKTTLLENLILYDIRSDDPPSMVIIDPHGDMIKRLLHADLGIEDRLVYINPRDTEFPPAVNIFAANQDRLGSYDQATREQVSAGVLQTFDYLFSGLFGFELTGKQTVPFQYVTRLLLSFPETLGRNATILDMLNLMVDAEPYRVAIDALPPFQRDFFYTDFLPKTGNYRQTKEQIRARLHAVVANPTLERLFTSETTKVDLFTELNRGSIVLVDTAKDFLKQGSATFGRIFISLTLQAVLERAAVAEDERQDTFLIVDEAASYFDSNIDDLLTEVRKFRCGCVFSHQYLDQASSSLRASLAANTNIKFASGLSAQDARAMAPEMRTTPDFILNQPKLQFAAHIRNATPQAVSIPIQPRSALPQLSVREFEHLIENNRAKVSIKPEDQAVTAIGARSQAPAATPMRLDPGGLTDLSPEW
jgi:hypothetical protein